jgi:hypothetical protein
MVSPLRRYLYALLLLILIPAGVQAAIWIAEAIEAHRTPAPVKAVRAFLEALRGRDCEPALAFLAEASRRAVEARAAAQRTLPGMRPPQACRWAFHGLRAQTAQLKSQEAGRAVIAIERHESDPKSFLIPGFWATRSIVTPAEMRLVDEGGAWKVVVP